MHVHSPAAEKVAIKWTVAGTGKELFFILPSMLKGEDLNSSNSFNLKKKTRKKKQAEILFES